MRKEEFLDELAQILGFSAGTLKGTELLQDIQLWDSMGRLSFILLAEEKLGYVVDGTKVSEAHTINELIVLVHDKLEL